MGECKLQILHTGNKGRGRSKVQNDVIGCSGQGQGQSIPCCPMPLSPSARYDSCINLRATRRAVRGARLLGSAPLLRSQAQVAQLLEDFQIPDPSVVIQLRLLPSRLSLHSCTRGANASVRCTTQPASHSLLA